MSWSDDAAQMQSLFSAFRPTASAANAGSQKEADLITEMGANRRISMQKNAAAAGGSISLATGRPTDPLFYWKNSNLPYNIWEKGELAKVRALCRLLYILHPVIGSCVDIYSKYPLSGMEIVCPKDKMITDFYTDLFFDGLDYEEFLIDVGREYWTVGEAWPFGTFNELLGIWEADELLQPDDMKVVRSPFLKDPRFEMRIPAHIRKILIERKPQWEYQQLVAAYPEMASMASLGDLADEDDQRAWMPVSNVLVQQLRFKGDTFHDRGVPLLMRAFRAIMQEEMFNAAQEAIATRLYTPLILAKLGASASDLGTQTPWIPTQGDLDSFNESLNAALAADFRVITHHFGLEMSSVFGREAMLNLDNDFDRLESKILQTFGLSKTMLSGASAGETYAADALNRDLISQLLTSYQRIIKRLFKKRALVVAEAQGHYDFDMKGGRPVPIMEEVVETDEETGEQRIVEQPKLLVPDLRIKAMNMRDEDSFRQFIESLRSTGVPISQKTRLVNVPINLEEEVQATMDEQVQQAVAAQETRRKVYLELKRKGLPIPEDLLRDFTPTVQPPAGTDPEQQILETMGLGQPGDTSALSPTEEEIAAGQGAETPGEEAASEDGEASAVTVRLPRNELMQALPGVGARPPESDEQRAGMPRAASLVGLSGFDPATLERIMAEGAIEGDSDEQEPVDPNRRPEIRGPRHVGMRRLAQVDDVFYRHRSGTNRHSR